MEVALKDVKIIDFGIFFAGPYASKLLADLGAQVIKIESLTGDTLRRTLGAFNGAQRGKRAIALDLKTEEGKAIAYRLVREADVVQHNMRPGVAERLGIDYASVKEINPRVIYLYSPGYGTRGPRTNQGSFEPLVSGLTGIFDLSTPEGQRPMGATHGNMDYGNAMLGACAIMMALVHRERTGEGQYIECAQMSSGMLTTAEAYWLPDGTLAPQLRLDPDMDGVGPLMRLYPTSDGGWICLVCHTDEEWHRLLGVLGLGHLVNDPRFATWEGRWMNGPALVECIGPILMQRPAEEWHSLFDAARVPCEVPVQNGREAFLDDPESVRRGWVADYEHPVYGKMREIGSTVRLSAASGKIQGPPPTIGQHTGEILTELGYTPAEIEDMIARKVARQTLETGAIF